jgi:hypothetical protein
MLLKALAYRVNKVLTGEEMTGKLIVYSTVDIVRPD